MALLHEEVASYAGFVLYHKRESNTHCKEW